MQIHQVSVTYQAEQDRLLLRVSSTSGDEMRLWLTRRLMVGLWPLLTRLQTEQLLRSEAGAASMDLSDQELRRMLTEFRKEEFLQRADFDTPYEDKGSHPLGSEPLLVTDIDASPLPNGRLRLAFNERTAGAGGDKPRGFQLEMDLRLVQGMMHLLEQSLVRAQWREPFVMPTSPAVEGAEAEFGEERPRYLN